MRKRLNDQLWGTNMIILNYEITIAIRHFDLVEEESSYEHYEIEAEFEHESFKGNFQYTCYIDGNNQKEESGLYSNYKPQNPDDLVDLIKDASRNILKEEFTGLK